jgi:hypothetical protein
LKRYFQHPNDPRQRLHAEYHFLEYAWNLGLRCIPEPILEDQPANAAIYSYIAGQPVAKVSESLIQQTIDFFLQLNSCRRDALQLPNASEACFSIQEHVETIEKRVKRLQSFEHPDLNEFLTRLIPKWENIKKSIDLSSDHLLSADERCISPSDFGFHNAVLRENGEIAFIDFEYAGWDDPAKTVCDFFCQPRVPIPSSFFPLVSQQFTSIASHPAHAFERIRQLLDAYRIKWCCIILNGFSPIGQTRRTFAQMDEQKEEQLKKANQLLTQDLPWHT